MTTAGRPVVTELPILRLGLAGFTNAEQGSLCVALALRASQRQITWQMAPLGEADAWCVRGSRVQRLADGTVRIMPGLSSGRSIRVNLAEVDWPIAFSTPIACSDIKPTYSFDADSRESTRSMLEQLEGWLRPLMAQFYLASYIAHADLDLRNGVYHVSLNGKLLAMVSPRTGVGVWALTEPGHLRQAIWSHRPESADAIPSHFVRTGFAKIMWQYAIRTTRDCLPAHYRTRELYLRRPPPVPMRLLTDASLVLVRELGSAPGTFAELGQRTGMGDAQLSRHLAALCMVGAVTANAKRVNVRPGAPDSVPWAPSSRPADTALGATGVELTVRLTRDGHAGRESRSAPLMEMPDLSAPAHAAPRAPKEQKR